MALASERLVALGEIVATHGVGGWVKVRSYNPGSTALLSARQLFLEKHGVCSAHDIEASKPHKRALLVKLSGVNGIAAAKERVGSVVSVPEQALPPLEPGEYYQYQVVGLEVVDIKGERVGVVTRILSTPAGELYVVQGATKEHLIPATKEIVEKVDLVAGKMVVNTPEGLFEL